MLTTKIIEPCAPTFPQILVNSSPLDSNNDSFGTHSVKVLVQVHYPSTCGTFNLYVVD